MKIVHIVGPTIMVLFGIFVGAPYFFPDHPIFKEYPAVAFSIMACSFFWAGYWTGSGNAAAQHL